MDAYQLQLLSHDKEFAKIKYDFDHEEKSTRERSNKFK